MYEFNFESEWKEFVKYDKVIKVIMFKKICIVNYLFELLD